MVVCKICQSAGGKIVSVKDMMFGTKAKHDYLECDGCGCLQLIDIPADMGKYYDNDSYGSFRARNNSAFRRIIKAARMKYAIRGKGMLGYIVNKKYPLKTIGLKIIGEYANTNSRILDVGCGSGDFIDNLHRIGFKNVKGNDPFLKEEIRHSNGVVISNNPLDKETGKYDVVFSHHSFEHIPNPLEILEQKKAILDGDGIIIATMPMLGGLYEKYREHCYLIQAPHHIFLHTEKSMAKLAEEAGLRVERVIYDNLFVPVYVKMSEMWSRDIEDVADFHPTHKENEDMQKTISKLMHEGKEVATFILKKKEK